MPRLAPAKRLLPFAAVALVASLLGGGLALAGGNVFTDVGPTHPFYDEINGIAQAGITTGYGDGSYRSGDPVTRGAMAAFMARGFGRINTAGATINNPSDNTNTQIGVAVMDAGAASGAGGYVHLTADGQMSAPVADCTCTFVLEIVEQSSGDVVATRTSMSDDVNAFTINTQSTAVQGVVEIDPNTTETYQLRTRATTAGANTGITVSGRIVATYVPFPYNAYAQP